MFSQPPEDEQNKTFQNHPRQIPTKSLKSKNKRKGNKRNSIRKKQTPQSRFTISAMSSWAENFTHAATWQMKQQIAYWKSKATALEYENRILHDIIKQNYLNPPQTGANNKGNADNENITEQNDETESSGNEEDNEDLEVSEEFIQFLMSNAKYKEDARREREKFKALQKSEKTEVEQMEAMPTKSIDKEVLFKELYGENWQRIATLETTVQSQFLSANDGYSTEYWPNIPLNFNFG